MKHPTYLAEDGIGKVESRLPRPVSPVGWIPPLVGILYHENVKLQNFSSPSLRVIFHDWVRKPLIGKGVEPAFNDFYIDTLVGEIENL